MCTFKYMYRAVILCRKDRLADDPDVTLNRCLLSNVSEVYGYDAFCVTGSLTLYQVLETTSKSLSLLRSVCCEHLYSVDAYIPSFHYIPLPAPAVQGCREETVAAHNGTTWTCHQYITQRQLFTPAGKFALYLHELRHKIMTLDGIPSYPLDSNRGYSCCEEISATHWAIRAVWCSTPPGLESRGTSFIQ